MIRLSDTLKVRAQAYADNLGISLNALVSVALNDYLDARLPSTAVPSRNIDLAASVATVDAGARPPAPPSNEERMTAARAAETQVTDVPRGGADTPSAAAWQNTPRNAPCPCGSGRKFKLCHGKP